MLTAPPSHVQRYFALLGAVDRKELEDRIISDIATAVREEWGQGGALPIRLSSVAARFKIRPKPQLIAGSHDGEIEFDEHQAEFVIRLCTPRQDATISELGKHPRFRFTYAHEVAHRFFFVPWNGSWKRALDIITADLHDASQLKEKITLRRLEEGLCNNIARRVLVPDELIAKYCNVREWFNTEERFFEKLSDAARRFGVSRDCLLLRLEKSFVHDGLERNCAIVIGSSAGNVTAKGRYTLRVRNGILPSRVGGTEVGYYPGIQAEKLGDQAYQFVVENLAAGDPVAGRVRVPLRIGDHPARLLTGWWRLLGHDDEKRMMIWGQLD